MKGHVTLTFLSLSVWREKKNITKIFEVTFADIFLFYNGDILILVKKIELGRLWWRTPVISTFEVEEGGAVVLDQPLPSSKIDQLSDAVSQVKNEQTTEINYRNHRKM